MLEISTRMEADVVVVDIEGEIKGGPESEKLHTLVREQFEGGRSKIVMNMTKVPWINSFGLGIIMACLSTARRKEGDLRLYGLTKRTGMTMGITGLVPTLFHPYEDEASAVGSFK